MGPWKAVKQGLHTCKHLEQVQRLCIHLYGSLAKTGKGHGTDLAVMMGALGEDPETVDVAEIPRLLETIERTQQIRLLGTYPIPFDPHTDIVFHLRESLPFHPNALRVCLYGQTENLLLDETYYSIGGGFVIQEQEEQLAEKKSPPPYPIITGEDWKKWVALTGLPPWELVFENERSWRNATAIQARCEQLWQTMLDCIYRGCHTAGILPGGLSVSRRAQRINKKLMGEVRYETPAIWMEAIRLHRGDFQSVSKWLSCFALAVNEENAAFGRVVTAPTNGAAGVVPAVLMYMQCLCEDMPEDMLQRYLLVAGTIGSLFKHGATISAAMGGCQAEIGVSSAMAAAGLTACLGGSIEHILMAAEIAMEHHLGLTCDPIGGLVQIPCIERNTMGAIKAITAASIAIESDPGSAKVPFDAIVKTMWETALDMNAKYKETSEGGLALQIPVSLSEC